MIINGSALLRAAPIEDMLKGKIQADPTSYGLTECGYDIRIKQDIRYIPRKWWQIWKQNQIIVTEPTHQNAEWDSEPVVHHGRFVLASSIEEFQMPTNLMARIMNKSTWARLGVDAARGTNAEPGWNGHLTIELTFDGSEEVHIPAGSGILQVIFETITEHAQYVGKYQNQADRPVEAQLSLPL